jgi:hypothetical protein
MKSATVSLQGKKALLTTLENISDPLDKSFPPADDAGKEFYQLEIVSFESDLNKRQNRPPVDFHFIDENPTCSSSIYDPMRKMRIFPAPPPAIFAGTHRRQRFNKPHPLA